MPFLKLNEQDITICSFYDKEDQPCYCLANYSLDRVRIIDPLLNREIDWPTTEHYFQAQKISDKNERERFIRDMQDARPNACRTRVKDYNPKIKNNDKAWLTEWNARKEEVMLTALRAKYEQHAKVRELLNSTGTLPIIEDTAGADYTDDKWGAGYDGKGGNRLGVLWMQVRAEKREGKSAKDAREDAEKLQKVVSVNLPLLKRPIPPEGQVGILLQKVRDGKVTELRSPPPARAPLFTTQDTGVSNVEADIYVNAASIYGSESNDKKGEKLTVENWGFSAGAIRGKVAEGGSLAVLQDDWKAKGECVEAGTADFVKENDQPVILKWGEKKAEVYLVHAGAPISQGNKEQDFITLKAAYKSILEGSNALAVSKGRPMTIAIPPLGIGGYKCDPATSAQAAFEAITEIKPSHLNIVFPIFDPKNKKDKAFKETLARLEKADVKLKVPTTFTPKKDGAQRRAAKQESVVLQDQTINITAIKEYLESTEAQYGIKKITENSKKDQLTLNFSEEASLEKQEAYIQVDAEGGLQYSMKSGLADENIAQVSKLAVESAFSGAVFDLKNTPEDKQAVVYDALQKAIKVRPEKNITIEGYTPPQPRGQLRL